MREEVGYKKIFVNATHELLGLQYFTFFILFLVVPFGSLYLFFKALSYLAYSFTAQVFFIIVIMMFLFLILLVLFVYLRKFWVIKIITDDEGITCVGFLRNIYSRWEEIRTVEPFSIFFGIKMIKVTTDNGSFNFSLTMKEQGKRYPKIALRGLEWKWEDSEGNEMPISLENCPLYKDIQGHLSSISVKGE